MKVRVRYKGPGGEIFTDYHWLPKPGEVREIEVADDADLTDHPTLEVTTDPLTPQTETEIAADLADDPEEDENEDFKAKP